MAAGLMAAADSRAGLAALAARRVPVGAGFRARAGFSGDRRGVADLGAVCFALRLRVAAFLLGLAGSTALPRRADFAVFVLALAGAARFAAPALRPLVLLVFVGFVAMATLFTSRPRDRGRGVRAVATRLRYGAGRGRGWGRRSRWRRSRARRRG